MSDELLRPHLQTCLVFAARYAHNRATAAALVVTHAVIANWHRLKETTKIQIIDESNEATCNQDDWQKLRDFAKAKEEAK